MRRGCGYLTGLHVRDKDAVNAALLVCEMAAHYKMEGKTLCQVMDELYAQYGTYYTKADSFAFAGAGAMERMGAVMDRLRREQLPEIAGAAVAGFTDYRNIAATGAACRRCAHLGAGGRLRRHRPALGH